MEQLIKQYKLELNNTLKKYQSLRDLDIFVLDNSIRESTVGQLRGHTTEDKWRIFDEVKKCGFTDAIVASFTDDVHVDDDFLEELAVNAEDTTGLYAFSEITRNVINGIPDTSRLPIGLEKLKRVGMRNAILEIDLGDGKYDFNKFSIDKMCNLLLKLVTWCHDNLHKNSRVLVNFRDMPNAMSSYPGRVFRVVEFLAKLPPRLRLFGLLYEDPGGQCVPEEFSTWARYIRTIMDANEWKGHLLVHVHEQFCLGDVTVLEALMNGANGIWASVCHEGAPVGHAASIVTLINMIRHGNSHVVRRYNCGYLRQAAINVTSITTGHAPPTNLPIYGERALDCVLNLRRNEFDLAKFFGEKAPVRISSISSSKMICQRLIDLFGQDEQFTLEMADEMKRKMLQDLRSQRKEEYMSKHGLSVLFRRSGGSLTKTMRTSLVGDVQRTPLSRRLLKDIRTLWDSCISQSYHSNNELLPYDVFYVNFMQGYFTYYRSVDTRSALKALDFDGDGFINWEDFLVYITWALLEYPNTGSVHDVFDIVFRKGLTPIIKTELPKLERTEIRMLDKENRTPRLKKSEQLSGLSNRTSSAHKQFSKTTSFLPKIRL